MDPDELIKLAIAGFEAYSNFMINYQTVRATLNSEDQLKLDKAYHDLQDRSNAVADQLRATPDDK